ncbi:S1 RNA-binding domain-containing protein [Mycoplasma sp. NEAQ87857]|uniref:Tex-like N-terminal domain-containing protein n=1 Tax=Mycoplasma sp. NEAQ87857 TaxID=2683967 RepID=UPI001318468F|nr:Tex-like N-terminal domain-containing protein [Mycoplasma sp. NEAQ87857]QGZ97361.1 S1 RNA-binding domain-containing protein [Mycoplasma sp. NEAQ87857]
MIIEEVAKLINIKPKQVQTVLTMLENGDTVPFIARYRKDVTNGLDEEQIYQVEQVYKYQFELDKRRKSIIEILNERKLLTKELEQKINSTTSKNELEALYEPFKIGKVTKASMAIALGLEPLANEILNNTNFKFNPQIAVKKYLSKEIKTVEFAIEQANFIISQIISQNNDLREQIKKNIYQYGKLTTKLKNQDLDDNKKFENYYDFNSSINWIKNHQILAINRAVKLNIIKLNFEYKQDYFVTMALKIFDKTRKNKNNILDAINDALKRLILPSVEREIFNELFAKAEKSAINIFANSVETLLKAPAMQEYNVLAIDPAFVNGCKIAALSNKSQLLAVDKIYPNYPKNDYINSSKKIIELVKKYQIGIIVIGNGTASRETEAFIAKVIKGHKLSVKYAIVSEIGASVYSASKIAIEEFPNLDVEQRSAINIGRKFIDPLNELVKIDPKSIGVGQYQHDLNAKELESYLSFKVQKVVNQIGVDLNSASKYILVYIAGLSEKTASNIVEYRNENGNFLNRKQVLKVKGIGPKAYEQAIGFLRIFDSDNYLDKTAIHPDSYDFANKLIEQYEIKINDKNQDYSALKQEIFKQYPDRKYEIELIISALENPNKIFDNNKTGFILKDTILTIDNLNIGDIVDGTVQNVTDFGIFVYIGIKQTLFIHISKLNLNDNDIYDSYYPGQIIKANIIDIDLNKNQIKGQINN